LAQNEKRRPQAKKEPRRRWTRQGVSTLRELQGEQRRGNDAPWKAWKTPKSQSEFSTLSTGLGNPANNKGAGFPHFHRAGGGSIFLGRTKNETEKQIPVA
jgi:hypothetical protein